MVKADKMCLRADVQQPPTIKHVGTANNQACITNKRMAIHCRQAGTQLSCACITSCVDSLESSRCKIPSPARPGCSCTTQSTGRYTNGHQSTTTQ